MTKTWYFLRHGSPISTGILTGSRTDIALSEQGHLEMEAALTKIDSIDAIICSPLKRCQLFATKVAKTLNLDVQIEPKIEEMNFGLWDGKHYDWLWENTHSPTIGQFWQTPWLHTPPEGESLSSFRGRVKSWWQTELLHRKTSNHLIVTHAGVIKQILAEVLSLPIESSVPLNRVEIGYAKIIQIEVFIDDNQKSWPKVVF